MWFKVDPRAPTPVYQQIVEGFRETVAKGLMAPGDRLPSVRDLATEMMLNHNTVAKAYQELEREKVIEVIRGRGTYIAKLQEMPNRREKMDQIAHAMKQILVDAYHLQMTEADVWELFHRVVDNWQANMHEEEL